MSVLIKGLKIPKTCYECQMYEADIYYCSAAEREIDIPSSDEGRCSFCPLIEMPDHGDLIDRDALMARYAEEVKPSNNSDFMRPPRWNDAVQLTELAHVVIPAERTEE